MYFSIQDSISHGIAPIHQLSGLLITPIILIFFADENVVKAIAPHEISKGSLITTLENWGQSFIVDFFLHYSGLISFTFNNYR